MFLDIDQIRCQISASISIYSQPFKDYENLEKLQVMLADSVVKIKEALNSDNEEMLIILLDMIEYQKKRVHKVLNDKNYKDCALKRGKYTLKSKKK